MTIRDDHGEPLAVGEVYRTASCHIGRLAGIVLRPDWSTHVSWDSPAAEVKCVERAIVWTSAGEVVAHDCELTRMLRIMDGRNWSTARWVTVDEWEAMQGKGNADGTV